MNRYLFILPPTLPSMMLNDVFFIICVICIILQVLSSSDGASEISPRENIHSKKSDFVVPDLNKMPPEAEFTTEKGYANQHVTVSVNLQPSISHFDSRQDTMKRKRKKVKYSSLSQEEKSKRSKYNMERIRFRKQNMTKEERANWNARNLISVRKHRAKKSKMELQAQNRKYKQTYMAKQKLKLVNNTQSSDAKPK